MPEATSQQIEDLLREYQLDHDGHISIEASSGWVVRSFGYIKPGLAR